MELLKQYKEYLKEDKNQDLVHKLNDLIEKCQDVNNQSLYLKSSVLLSDVYVSLNELKKAIKLLNSLLKNTSKDNQVYLKLLDRLISIYLKTDSYDKTLEILDKKRFLLNDDILSLNTLNFYYSACFEGLLDYHKAIESLENITDDINDSLKVTKYLKLTILYLKVKDYQKALKSYDEAKKYDKSENSKVFKLAKSEILFYEKKYQQAKDLLESFLISSENKIKYIAKIIIMNLRLNNLEEAKNIYDKYLDEVKNHSKNIKIPFFEAGKLLFQKMRNNSESNKINDILEKLEPKKVINKNFDMNINTICKTINNMPTELRIRDFLHQIFKEIDKMISYDKLTYVDYTKDRVCVFEYKKGLLYEKHLSFEEIKSTLIEHAYICEYVNHLFDKEEISDLKDIYTHDVFKNLSFKHVNMYKILDGANPVGIILIYLSTLTQFNQQKKLLNFSKMLILEKIKNIITINNLLKKDEFSNSILDINKSGVFKISKNIFKFMNQEIKNIFNIKTDILNFDEIISLVHIEDKKIFYDNIYRKSEFKFRVVIDNEIKVVNSNQVVENNEVIGIMRDISNINKKENTLSNYAFLDFQTGLYNYNKLVLEYEKKKYKDYSFLMICIKNSDYIDDIHGYNEINNVLQYVTKAIKKVFKSSQHDKYYLGNYKFLIVINTKDKRVINKLAHNLYDKFIPKYITLNSNSLTIEISIGVNNDLKDTLLDEILNKANIALIHSKTSNELEYFDKTKSFNINHFSNIEKHIKESIENKTIFLRYQPVVDLKTNEIIIYDGDIDVNIFYSTYNEVFEISKRSSLVTKLEKYLLEKLLKDAKKIYKIRSSEIIFNLKVSKETLLSSDFIEWFIKKIKQDKIPLKMIAIEVSLNENMDETLINILESLSISGINIIFSDLYLSKNLFQLYKIKVSFVKIDACRWLEFDKMKKYEIIEVTKLIKKIFSTELIYDNMKSKIHLDDVSYIGGKYGKGELYNQNISIIELVKLLRGN